MPFLRNRFALLLLSVAALVLFALSPVASARLGVQGAAPQQNETAYPPDSGEGYPAEPTNPPDQGYPNPEQPSPAPTLPTSSEPTFAPLPSSTQNPLTPSPTAGRNLFGTEDSEMGNSQVTPPPSETPVPTPTLTPSITPSVTPDVSGFHINNRLFSLGFLLPLGLFIFVWLGYRLVRTGEFKSG
jgi:hypothetical protein